jgi:hypothetical protein
MPKCGPSLLRGIITRLVGYQTKAAIVIRFQVFFPTQTSNSLPENAHAQWHTCGRSTKIQQTLENGEVATYPIRFSKKN